MYKTDDKCDFCGEEMEAEFVDIGIGWQQVTESRCPNMCEVFEWYERKDKENEN